MEPIKEIQVLTQEGSKFLIERQIAVLSGFLREQIEELEDENHDDVPVILVQSVNGATLRRIIRFCRHHIKEPMIPIEVPSKGDFDDVNVVSKWDQETLDINIDELVDLVRAATFLRVNDLFELTCFKMAHMIKGKNEDEIRKTLKIKDDLSDLERKKLKEDNQWLEGS